MSMQFSGEFSVPVAADEVMRAFADVPRMAGLMPGAFIDGRDDDGAYRGGMLVAFGPKKIRFHGKVQLALDAQGRSGSLVGRGTADLRAARIETKIHFEVKEAAPRESTVALRADTMMGGVLADFAKTGGPVVAKMMMEEFALRLRQDLQAQAQTPAAPDNAIRFEQVLWALLRRWFRQLTGRS